MDQAIARATGATPSTTPPQNTAAGRAWSILLTSENHGTVGPVGCAFPWAGEKHERVLVVEVPAAAGAPSDQVNLKLVPAPSAPVGAAQSIDTPEFIELLSKVWNGAHPRRGLRSVAGLIAHIDQHVASQVRAARDAALEEAAALTIKRTAVPRDVLGPATPQMKSLAAAGAQLADKIAALKGRPAISHSGEGEKGGAA